MHGSGNVELAYYCWLQTHSHYTTTRIGPIV